MNVRAQQLGLQATRTTPTRSGSTSPATTPPRATSCGSTLRLRAFDFFRRTVAREQVTLRSGDRPRTLENRNGLVRLPQVNGVKTGHTQQAGYVLVGSGRQDGITLISVVLGAPSVAARESDTRRLLRLGVHALPARARRRARRGARARADPLPPRRGARPRGRRQRAALRRAPGPGAAPLRPARRRPRSRGRSGAARRSARSRSAAAGSSIATLPVVASADVPKAGAAVRTKDWFTRPLTLVLVVLARAGR